MKLEIALDAEAVAPGGTLRGLVDVLEGGEARSLTLTVSFCESSPSYMAVPFGRSDVIHEGDLATGQAVTFQYELPEWAPPGVKSEHAALFWQVEAIADRPGLDARASRQFQITR
jgi:hypothetical protein